MADRLRVGIVGLNFGIQHLRTLANRSDAVVVAVADRRGRAEAIAASYRV